MVLLYGCFFSKSFCVCFRCGSSLGGRHAQAEEPEPSGKGKGKRKGKKRGRGRPSVVKKEAEVEPEPEGEEVDEALLDAELDELEAGWDRWEAEFPT
jgi:hypothetical protein